MRWLLLVLVVGCAVPVARSRYEHTDDTRVVITSRAYDDATVRIRCDGRDLAVVRYATLARREVRWLPLADCVRVDVIIDYFASYRRTRVFERVPGITEGATLEIVIGPSYATTYFTIRSRRAEAPARQPSRTYETLRTRAFVLRS